jgi:diguanylate cyclase (GGDEF)-like protein
MERDGMISLKRYLDLGFKSREGSMTDTPSDVLFSAYRQCLIEIGECSAEACPGLGPDLVHGIGRILEEFGPTPSSEAIRSSEPVVRDLLRSWGTKTAQHYDRKAGEVKDLLLVMARTAESLGQKDDRYARHLDSVTSQLESIANLEDVTRIRTSVESSARELKNSVAKMSAESRAVIDHLRAEVSTYQAKLEKAEYVASRDSLTGLGSRHWIESRISQRIEVGCPFAIVLIDIDGFSRVIDKYGNLVGDLLLKEFARELRSSCRFTDIVGRWGGDEFIVVLDHCGPEMQTQVGRLRTQIAKSYHVPGRTGYVNVRLDVLVGTAEYRVGEHLQDLLERADAEMCLHRGYAKAEKTA